jgi:3,4-dihydroxy 2-butanone 4-phosphate synthase / GTP cyclohydrolase II
MTDSEKNEAFLSPISEAVDAVRNGEMVIVVDDEDRENEGDFLMSAEKATPEAINFMATHGRGLICLPSDETRLQELDLMPMVSPKDNKSRYGTAFTVTIDAVEGTTTGISAHDRSITIQKFADPNSVTADFARPGHIFPLTAAPGGVLRRAGHTEAAVDLARMAGHSPAGVICEILNEDGTMARVPQLIEMARRFDLKMISIKDMIATRQRSESLVERVEDVQMPTEFGDFRLVLFESLLDHEYHPALVKGDLSESGDVLVRMHSQCMTGDVFGSRRCDCGDQLHAAMAMIEKEGRGAVVYMRQEGRGIGLLNKLKAYRLQEDGLDTVEANHRLGFPADSRDYGIGAQILHDLGIHKVRLITNNPAKRVGIEGYGLDVVEMVPLIIEPNTHNEHYLRTKMDKMGHLLEF